MNYSFFKKLNYLFTDQDRRLLVILFIMSFFLSIIETIGISAIMPFISTASNPEVIHTNQYYKMAYDFFGLTSNKEFIVLFGILLVLFYIFRGLYTIFHGHLVAKFSMNKYRDFSDQLFENYIHMPYIKYVQKNTATMSRTIHTEASYLSLLVQNILIFFVETMVVITLYMLMLAVNVKMTIVLTFILGAKMLLLSFFISKRIKIMGFRRAEIQEDFYKIVNASLSNLKIIKFISNQSRLISEYKKVTNEFSKIHISSNTLQLIPKTFIEATGLSILMLVVIYVVVFQDNIGDVIPLISMYALALYRILPATTKIMHSYNHIMFFSATLDPVYSDISCKYIEEEYDNYIDFKDSIEIKNLYFTYDKKSYIVDNLSLKIKKGQKIAFIGESGSGKSTLVDLICGIYTPSSGQILIDGIVLDNSNIVSWRRRIGYIPQAIYLFDGTVADNITFGRDYDEKKLFEVLMQANIYKFIMQKDGLDTIVGENGIQLSGGQKQRIGIARALYGDPEILVLDEATSALDTETEKVIMDEIYKISEDKTLMIVAHRLSTIKSCDVKIDLSNDSV